MNGVAQDQLPGVIGHEVRNPLASAMTGAMLARDMVDSDDPRAAVLDGVLRDLDRMTGLIDGWLQLARDQQVGERVGVEELLDAVASRTRAEVVSAPPSAWVRGNRCLLERALENLCENARNAGAANVRFAAQHDGGNVHIHVEDDGKGVDPEQTDKIFAAGWSGAGGTGLGLHAVRTTVEAMGGDVECVALVGGTRFTISVPMGGANPR